LEDDREPERNEKTLGEKQSTFVEFRYTESVTVKFEIEEEPRLTTRAAETSWNEGNRVDES
jgi:hypothetical protein